ncbi:hypothetical protein [Candidatus Puniceispirillum marinum]|uniref:Large extracellular alpha-helical protein n=1 Tax=Puniceispirillum marinum (strain IMCC1322) TaxID=488538 RepID=D5BTC6_PUNMI|nr:hypothetical protein [Candidatus Puniceispirillum marinum]ADE39523.1 Large extracellular alpha-helical protein [Candidatus Puniceispirillum marinum IMCC1322]
MKSSFTECFVAEIDEMIKDELGADVFCLPPSGYDYDGEVKPIYSTHSEHYLVFLLKILPASGKPKFMNIYCSDGGVFAHRSKLKDDSSELMFPTEEGWTEF